MLRSDRQITKDRLIKKERTQLKILLQWKRVEKWWNKKTISPLERQIKKLKKKFLYEKQ